MDSSRFQIERKCSAEDASRAALKVQPPSCALSSGKYSARAASVSGVVVGLNEASLALNKAINKPPAVFLVMSPARPMIMGEKKSEPPSKCWRPLMISPHLATSSDLRYSNGSTRRETPAYVGKEEGSLVYRVVTASDQKFLASHGRAGTGACWDDAFDVESVGCCCSCEVILVVRAEMEE